MAPEPSKKGRKKKSKDKELGTAQVGRPPTKAKTKIVIPLNAAKLDKRKTSRLKSEAKSKDKAPVDVERQCGVALPNGGYCARSLTCKTHSMGAKRAVPGRSMPYDALLAAYQKRNQVKMASLSTQQQLELDNEALMDEQPLNVDEEFEQVMAGVVRAYPVPLERKVVMPTKSRTGFFRMREMLIGSLTTVPPIPSVSSDSTGAQQSVNAVMSATGAVLGRTIVFDSTSGAQYARPPRVYINPNATLLQQQQQQQAMLIRQRQLQLAMQQQRLGANASVNSQPTSSPTPATINSQSTQPTPAQLQMAAAAMARRQMLAKAQAQAQARAH
jgi:SAGA-associated factor 73